MMNTLLDAAQSFAIIAAALVALYSINAWRRESRWRRKQELAEEALTLFYEARAAIGAIRSPLEREGEGQSRESNPGGTPQEKELLDSAFVAIERRKQTRVFESLRAKRYRFMACFGRDAEEPFAELAGVVNKIVIDAKWLGKFYVEKARLSSDSAQAAQRRKGIEHSIRSAESTVYDFGKQVDEITKAVDKIISDMEGFCQPILSSPPTLIGRIEGRIKALLCWLRC